MAAEARAERVEMGLGSSLRSRLVLLRAEFIGARRELTVLGSELLVPRSELVILRAELIAPRCEGNVL